MIHPDNHPRFAMFYPLSADLGLKVVDAGPGFDSADLQRVLDDARFAALMKRVTHVFVCGHRKHPEGHTDERFKTADGGPLPLGGTEVHCVYAADVEAFLQAGG